MNDGQIQLGVKISSGELPDRRSSQGFFYGGGLAVGRGGIAVNNVVGTARQAPDFSNNLCRRYVRNEMANSRLAVRPESSPLRVTRLLERIGQSYLPAPFFKDNSLCSTSYDNTKPFQSGAMINSPKKVNCCMERNRIYSTSKTRMNNYGGVTQVQLRIRATSYPLTTRTRSRLLLA